MIFRSLFAYTSVNLVSAEISGKNTLFVQIQGGVWSVYFLKLSSPLLSYFSAINPSKLL